MTTIACVLRSGGDYGPEHVTALYRGMQKHHPEGSSVPFICLTDMRVQHPGIETIPLVGGWKGWWSKMELFRPDVPGDLLFFDLDTLIVGDLSDIAATDRLTIMRGVYRPKGLQSSMMMVPEAEKAAVWGRWLEEPKEHMWAHRSDQEFLATMWTQKADRWQDVLPGQVVSYKVDCQERIPDDARVVIYHGQPRPWETELWERAAA